MDSKLYQPALYKRASKAHSYYDSAAATHYNTYTIIKYMEELSKYFGSKYIWSENIGENRKLEILKIFGEFQTNSPIFWRISKILENSQNFGTFLNKALFRKDWKNWMPLSRDWIEGAEREGWTNIQGQVGVVGWVCIGYGGVGALDTGGEHQEEDDIGFSELHL